VARRTFPRRRRFVRQRDEFVDARTLGEATGPNRRGGEAFAGRLVSGSAPLTLPAGQVVDGDDALARVALRHDFVAEDGTGKPGPAELFHVGAAEPAGEHGNELAITVRLVHLGQAGPACAVEHDRAHHSSRPKNELDKT
jgi:hypothetical protein